MNTAVVLLSAGLDSTVNLHIAKKELNVVLAITFDYGQRAATREIERARELCQSLEIPHRVIDLKWLGQLGQSALTDTTKRIPTTDVSIDDFKQSTKTAKAVWVPNRNGVFLNVAAAVAEALGANTVVPGFNIEEGATFPDNTQEFLDATTSAFKFSTANHIQAKCFTTNMNKTEIVKTGKELGVNFDLVWACYFAEEKPCGQCESCQRFTRALQKVPGTFPYNEQKSDRTDI